MGARQGITASINITYNTINISLYGEIRKNQRHPYSFKHSMPSSPRSIEAS